MKRALARAQQLIPALSLDLIVSAGLVGGKPIPPLLSELRRCCPGSRVLLLLDPTELVVLPGLPALRIEGGVLWRDVTPAKFRHVLTLLEDGFVVGSYQLAQSFYDAAPSQRERRVLALLCAGQTHDQIAAGEHVSLRTVDRLVRALSITLGAASPVQLGVRAAQLGLLGDRTLAGKRQTGGMKTPADGRFPRGQASRTAPA